MLKPSATEKWVTYVFLPALGVLGVIGLWALASSTVAPALPSPWKTWETSKPYVLEPFEKRGELDQGILRFTWYSLGRVAKGYAIALILGTPLGLLLGSSKMFASSFDPIIQILRPVSPLAWLPLGLVLFGKPEPAGTFTIAMCSMWPTVLNTALGIAWLVIVAAEMLTGAPGVGGFLWQEYNSLIYEHIILCILTIGLVGYALDRLMMLVERRFRTAST